MSSRHVTGRVFRKGRYVCPKCDYSDGHAPECPTRHVTEGEVLQTYTLQLIGPSNENDPMRGWWLPKLLRETEENLTDLLPDGYSVRIREWDAEEETPR